MGNSASKIWLQKYKIKVIFDPITALIILEPFLQIIYADRFILITKVFKSS